MRTATTTMVCQKMALGNRMPPVGENRSRSPVPEALSVDTVVVAIDKATTHSFARHDRFDLEQTGLY